MKLFLLAVTGAVLTVVASTGTASAATTARLAGPFNVQYTRVSSTNGGSIGATYYEGYTFRPICNSGVCATILSYIPDDVTRVRIRLVPSGSTYTGSRTYLAPCFDSRGFIKEAKAYRTTESATLKVTKASNGRATAISGTDTEKQVFTDAGRAAGCRRAGTNVYSVEGTHA